MNSVEESASPTKACSDHDNDDLSKSSTHHQYGPFVASYSNLEQRDTVIEKLFNMVSQQILDFYRKYQIHAKLEF